MEGSCEIKTLSGMGMTLGNVLRKVALTQLDSWRPVAFSVGTNSNVITAGDNVVEDMVEFASSLSKMHFTVDTDKPAYVLTFDTSCLKVSDFETDKVHVFSNDDREILHTVSGTTTVTVFLRNGKGSYSAKENEKFLKDSPDTAGLCNNAVEYLNSRHCDIERPGFSVDKREDCEIIYFHVDSLIDISADKIVSECCGILFDSFAENYDEG